MDTGSLRFVDKVGQNLLFRGGKPIQLRRLQAARLGLGNRLVSGDPNAWSWSC